MIRKYGTALAITSIVVYVLGGIGTFAGLVMIFMMKGKTILDWGDAASLGYLFLSVGLCLSILGVLLMRIIRNRLPR